ncbi:unnamed protein product [Haemonchus placei]|uniref:Lipoprotein n=1 Tax=Haemonchus placei TaxID=6290 RepID=A0A0N4WPF2_HAEPC|nr:unnamed protein product [Haemonchus placei]
MLRIVTQVDINTAEHQIVDLVYQFPAVLLPKSPQTLDMPISSASLKDTSRLKQWCILLTLYQQTSLKIGMANQTVARIQATFGTGNTILGAIIAGLLTQHKMVTKSNGQKVTNGQIVTANNDVAYFTNAMLALEEFGRFDLMIHFGIGILR